jgi:galactonate dehydratase
MKRRHFLGGLMGTAGAAAAPVRKRLDTGCDCSFFADSPLGVVPGLDAFKSVGSKVRITGMKAFGVTLSKESDRPYVFVKIETNVGVVGWGEGTLEGKAGAVIACVDDFKELIVGNDPMQVEHLYQLMYIGSFYRGGPVIGSATSGIDQALWDIRGKLLGMPVYKLLGGPMDSRGVRGYYHSNVHTLDELHALRDTAKKLGITAFKFGLPGFYEWLETNEKISNAVKILGTIREGLGPDIDIAVDYHAKPSPTIASILAREMEPLNLLFIEEVCPPENVRAMKRVSSRTTIPIATGERLVASYSCTELIEMGIVDILQTDINHVGGITALWKVSALAEPARVTMAPHACEGPIGAIASTHVDAAMPNFLIQEICSPIQPGMQEKVWEEWLGFPAMRMVNGRFPLTEKPGLGFELSESAFKKYPFQGTRPFSLVFLDDGAVGSR